MLNHKQEFENRTLSRLIRRASKAVDNDPPRLDVLLTMGLSKNSGKLKNVILLRNKNVELVKTINTIYRTTGKTDNHMIQHIQYRSKFDKNQLEKLRKQNRTMFRRFRKAESMYKQALLTSPLNQLLSPGPLDQYTIVPVGIRTIPSKRNICYFDISIGRRNVGRMEFEVYTDVVPMSAQNFVEICNGDGRLSYKGTVIHRVIPGLFCIGGDVINKSGTGGESIYGSSFPDENHHLLHSGPGVLSMFALKPDSNTSQFLITFKKVEQLDKRFVVIGKLIKTQSLKVLEMIEEFGTKTGKPRTKICVEQSGIRK